mmetsp:Transcript_52455/g.162744  ORF Transcript_52455/g.162744 Transcript_52455/m.162744 type:complete len:508 (-) Transcript_52455:36-1559(-)
MPVGAPAIDPPPRSDQDRWKLALADPSLHGVPRKALCPLHLGPWPLRVEAQVLMVCRPGDQMVGDVDAGLQARGLDSAGSPRVLLPVCEEQAPNAQVRSAQAQLQPAGAGCHVEAQTASGEDLVQLLISGRVEAITVGGERLQHQLVARLVLPGAHVRLHRGALQLPRGGPADHLRHDVVAAEASGAVEVEVRDGPQPNQLVGAALKAAARLPHRIGRKGHHEAGGLRVVQHRERGKDPAQEEVRLGARRGLLFEGVAGAQALGQERSARRRGCRCLHGAEGGAEGVGAPGCSEGPVRVQGGVPEGSLALIPRVEVDRGTGCDATHCEVWVLLAEPCNEHATVAATERDDGALRLAAAETTPQLRYEPGIVSHRLLHCQAAKVRAAIGSLCGGHRAAVASVLHEHDQGPQGLRVLEDGPREVVERLDGALVPQVQQHRPPLPPPAAVAQDSLVEGGVVGDVEVVDKRLHGPGRRWVEVQGAPAGSRGQQGQREEAGGFASAAGGEPA